MSKFAAQLRDDALAIWRAGLEAVRSDLLVREHVVVADGELAIGEDTLLLDEIERIVVVGAGKAGAGMAISFEAALGETVARQKQLSGWINVPDDCIPEAAIAPRFIHLHPARPAGRNEPTAEGVRGAEEILRVVAGLGRRDLCVCLLSGGGSALLPAPVPEISLADKLAVTKHLSGVGANIRELNTVRKQLSRIKGGGLARACRAGRLITLIISDVLGDPLDIIASGPTVPDVSTPGDALDVLEKFQTRGSGIPATVYDYLQKKRDAQSQVVECEATNYVIGNNAVAVDAAGVMAERLGYSHAMHSAKDDPTAEEVGRHLAEMAVRMRGQAGPNALISGGEPTVRLIDAAERGRGGRNQQLVLAALEQLAKSDEGRGIVIVSGGTDGEDGPTDAAGAICDEAVIASMMKQKLSAADYLRRNDAYSFFELTGGLLKTGPTHTNVCDLRVIVVDREA